MKAKLARLAAVVLLCTAAGALAVEVGDKPALQFKSVGGATIDLATLHGKIVVVDFWATWCGPCMAEAEHMVQLNNKYGDSGLQMIGISLDSDLSAMKAVAAEKGFTWPMAFDGRAWQSAYAKAWGVDSIPRTFLISPDGDVLWTGHPARIDAELEKAFREHPPVPVEPATLAAGNKSLDAVSAALDAGKTADAFKAMAGVPDEAKKDHAFADRQTKLANDLQSAGSKALADADALVGQKEYVAAAAQLRDLAKSLGGSPLGKQAQAKLDTLLKDRAARAAIEADKKNALAAAALEKAKALAAQNRKEMAYISMKSVAKTYPGTPAGSEASAAVAEHEKDPALAKRANDAAASGPANSALNLAASYAAAGKTELARAKYQSVIDQYPGTRYAASAKTAIAELGN